ncbi:MULTISPECIES: DUF302 domain-containing protein [unclassified Nocardia]|uniref:DUF302 domain-containing protein n=1 Tax=unclassified Nocardia TaxID=2637762 RepID=UPI00278BF08F|nr:MULTISPECIES: DUF302 domain-containing protein [unclassified Nocardia]
MSRSLFGHRRRALALVAAAATATLTAAACGNDTDDATSTAAATATVSASADQQTPAAASVTLLTSPAGSDFDATVEALKKAVSDNGMMILGDLDQAGALQTTGLNLKGAHTFFVGNPSAGKMFFEQTPAIGAVIPLQFLVWADGDGKTSVSYFDPKPLFTAVDPTLADGGAKMADAATMIVSAATGGSAAAHGTQQTARLVTVDAKGGFDDAVNALARSASDNGMMVLGDLDQAGALQTTGLNLKGAHTFFVGNPSAGKMFFEQTPAIGTVIPLRILVWADSDGGAHVSYFDPEPMFTAVDSGLAEGGQKMSDAAAMIANAVK